MPVKSVDTQKNNDEWNDEEAPARPRSRRGVKSLTANHKEALRLGRQQAGVVRRYLRLLETTERSDEPHGDVSARIAKLERDLENAELIDRVMITQQLLDLQGKAKTSKTGADRFGQAEADFIAVAAEFSDRRGISRQAWETVGVPSKVLDKAGIRQ